MAHSRRRAGSRAREVIVSFLLILLLLFLLALLAAGGWFVVNYYWDRQSGTVSVEKSRNVIPESFPDGELERKAASSSEISAGDRAEDYLERMTLEEKVAQMFMITPEALTGFQVVTAAGETTKTAYEKYPVGGLIYFKDNLESPDQVKDMLESTLSYSKERIGLPVLIGVDEEGGTEVARVAKNPAFGVRQFPDMAKIGASGDPSQAYQVGDEIGAYLSELGFNLDFAPVADVLTNPKNKVVARRSFGDNPEVVKEFALQVAEGLKNHGVVPVLKHFPGHGATAGDTHKGYSYTDKTLEELMKSELVPFCAGADAGIGMIMVSHIAVPQITGSDIPSSLSKEMVTTILRDQLGYQNIVITDSMNMGAIAKEYQSGEAAVKAIQAGVDMILYPQDFQTAYQAVLNAVKDGTITEERINESLERIINVKLGLED